MNSSLETLKTPVRRSVHSPLSEALEQFDRTAVRLGLDSGAMQLLRSPRRELRYHWQPENQITGSNAARVHGAVRVIAEAANGPTTSEASRLLEERGVLIIPDIVANAGGVTCSHFEQVQGQANYYWDRDEVVQQVDSCMKAAYVAVHDRAEREHASLRDGAHLIAVERVARACRERGWV